MKKFLKNIHTIVRYLIFKFRKIFLYFIKNHKLNYTTYITNKL